MKQNFTIRQSARLEDDHERYCSAAYRQATPAASVSRAWSRSAAINSACAIGRVDCDPPPSHRSRCRYVAVTPACRNRVQLANPIRGYAVEFGVIAAKGQASIDRCCCGCKLTSQYRPWRGSCLQNIPRNTPSLTPKLLPHNASILPMLSNCITTRTGLPRCAISVTSHIRFQLQEAW
jgi:hypothetical protein